MLRHFQLFAPAPGREAEAEHALARWLEEVAMAGQFRGGSVLREYAGEFGDIAGALAVIYDVESREAGAEFREATTGVRNPMAQDLAGDEPADQGEVLFQSSHGHVHGADGEHPHDDHGSQAPAPPSLRYDRGGGLLARLMHGHFTIVASQPPQAAADAAIEEVSA